MSSTWVKLTPDEARDLYRVSAATTEDPAYEFYESSAHSRSSEGSDGPWSLIAMERHDDTVTLRIANIEHEQLDWKDFDPLRRSPNFLLLRKPDVDAMAELLTGYADRLSGGSSDTASFTELDDEGIAAFHLDDEVFAGHTQSFHAQADDGDGPGTDAAVVFFSSIDPQPAELLFIGMSPGHITLDGPGLRDLAALLESESEHLADR